jgi:hypothetical protein
MTLSVARKDFLFFLEFFLSHDAQCSFGELTGVAEFLAALSASEVR